MARILLGIVVILTASIGLAVRFLPWWGVPLVVVGLAVAAKYAGQALLKRFAIGLFQAKSAALRDASLKLRSVVPVAPLPAEEYVDEEEKRAAQARRWFAVEVAITPAGGAGTFTHWEPGELRFTRPGMSLEDDDNEAADVRGVEIFADGAFRKDDGEKLQGSHVVRLTAAVHEGLAKATLRYYFEELGVVDFGAPRAG